MSAADADAAVDVEIGAGPVLYFDGVCNLCSSSVQFVIDHEAAPELRFASLQSPLAAHILPALGKDPAKLNSVVLVDNGVAYERSTAALRVAVRLKAPWRWMGVFLIVPAVLRDLVYELIAKNRYRMFGKKEACWLPSPALKARFIA